jgi:hypothetical protein
MSLKNLGSIVLMAALTLSVAAAASAQQHKPRPRLARGQTTNWTPHAGANALVGGLVTQNIGPGLTPAQLATTILGAGVAIQNVTFTGANVAAGTFQGGTGIIGFESGIVLSTGDMNSIVGPNVSDSTTTINGTPGDPQLDALIPGYTTFDSCVLEFDFACPQTQTLSFQFVFASEEFNEWVNSPYNDVFGFFVNGVNIAIVPGTTTTPVSINNVNCNNPYAPPTGAHCSQYLNNDLTDGGGTINTEMDGLTLVFTATANVNPGWNHIKLAIADAGDQVLDSNVFIRAGSLTCGTPGPVCELPMPALELGAAPQATAAGVAFTHPIRTIATNGLAGQHVTVSSVTASFNGSGVVVPANVSIAPALPVTGQPALSTFSWTPTASQAGTWRFVYHLVDQLGATGVGSVQIDVASGGYPDESAWLVAAWAPADISVGQNDWLLIDLTNAQWFPVTETDTPDWHIPYDPSLLGFEAWFQVGLVDSATFPSDPVKTSNGIHITIGLSTIQSYGPTSGITLWSNTPPLLDTDFQVHFLIL